MSSLFYFVYIVVFIFVSDDERQNVMAEWMQKYN